MVTTSTDPAMPTAADPSDPTPRRHVAALELFAGVALVASTVVALTVVSIGIARADTMMHWHPDSGAFAAAASTVVALVGLSALSGAIAWIVPWAIRAMRRA